LDSVVTANWSRYEVLLQTYGLSAYLKGTLGIMRVIFWA
jgi:hypothetical protein